MLEGRQNIILKDELRNMIFILVNVIDEYANVTSSLKYLAVRIET